jgi:hypothetical protein
MVLLRLRDSITQRRSAAKVAVSPRKKVIYKNIYISFVELCFLSRQRHFWLGEKFRTAGKCSMKISHTLAYTEHNLAQHLDEGWGVFD